MPWGVGAHQRTQARRHDDFQAECGWRHDYELAARPLGAPVSTWVALQRTTTSPTPPQAPTPATVSLAFQHGLADRQAWEDWYATTSGDHRNGALYWSAQRSLPHPGYCAALGGDATAGCLAAQPRLEASHNRHKQEPDYRRGSAILILVFCLWQAFVTCSAARWAGSGRAALTAVLVAASRRRE